VSYERRLFQIRHTGESRYPGSFQLKHETEVWIPAAAGMTKQTNPNISEPFQKLSA
jgi:hypothetical protein